MKKLNKSLILIIIILMISTLAIGCSSNEKVENNDFSIGVVLSKGDAKDNSLNKLVLDGLKSVKNEFGIDSDYIEIKKDREYLPDIETFVEEEKSLIVGVGRDSADAMLEAARSYTESKFLLIDYNYEDHNERIPSNMICVTFRERQLGYLVGLVAGQMTKSNSVGFIGENKVSSIVRFEEGFEAGVRSVNPKAKIISRDTDSKKSNEEAKSIASEMFKGKVDIIFSPVGKLTKTIVEEAKSNNKYFIGVDTDQNVLAPNNVLTSAIKNVELSMLQVVKDTMNDRFRGGRDINYGLKEGGIGLATSTNKNVPQDIIDTVYDEASKIIEWNYIIRKN